LGGAEKNPVKKFRGGDGNPYNDSIFQVPGPLSLSQPLVRMDVCCPDTALARGRAPPRSEGGFGSICGTVLRLSAQGGHQGYGTKTIFTCLDSFYGGQTCVDDLQLLRENFHGSIERSANCQGRQPA